jgi:hypothetical protein
MRNRENKLVTDTKSHSQNIMRNSFRIIKKKREREGGREKGGKRGAEEGGQSTKTAQVIIIAIY